MPVLTEYLEGFFPLECRSTRQCGIVIRVADYGLVLNLHCVIKAVWGDLGLVKQHIIVL